MVSESTTLVGGEWMKAGRGRDNSEVQDRTRSRVGNGAEEEREGTRNERVRELNNQVLRAVSLRTLLLDISLKIPIRRSRGCAPHPR